jgi:hypothetical protein
MARLSGPELRLGIEALSVAKGKVRDSIPRVAAKVTH